MINDIIDAAASTIHAGTGWRVCGVTDNPPAPCVMLYPASPLNEDDTYFLTLEAPFTFLCDIAIDVIVPTAALDHAARLLNDMISPTGQSIPAVLGQNPSLGTDWCVSVLQVPTSYGTADAGSVRVLVAKMILRVTATGVAWP